MILADYFYSKRDITWDYAVQCGVKKGVIRLPETDDFDICNENHWKQVHKNFTDFGIEPVIIEPMPNSLHDHIKIGDEKRDESIEKAIKMFPIMEKLGINTICFNFMAHIGWLRTSQDIKERGGPYQSLSTYSTRHQYFIDGEWVVGYAPSSNANPILSWEKSESYNIGVDFNLWNRLRGSVEYYIRRSPDLLYQYTAPQPPYVHPSILVNVGTTTNRGVEVSLNGDILSGKAVNWNMGVNYAYGRTYLTKLSSDIYKAAYLDLYLKPGVGTSEYFFRVEEGGEIGQFYGYEYAGTDEQGNMLVFDNEGKAQPVGSADATWKRNIGNGAPKHTLSWSNQLSWKGFDLSILFTGAFDYDIFNMRKYGMGLQGCGTDNVLRTAYTKDKDVKTGGGVISSYFLEDGSYIKLDNITFGYNWDWKDKVVDGLRLYVTAKNVATFTGYSGNDPSIVAVNGITPGVDTSSAYPTATQFCLGVTLKLH